MADIVLDEQAGSSSPSAGQHVLFPDSGSSAFAQRDDSGRYSGDYHRAAIAAQGAGFSADTYVTSSGLILPSWSMQAGMVFEWKLSGSKTAAGVAAPAYTIRIGANQTTGDTARLALTGPAQTAIADIGCLTILIVVQSVGAAGVIAGSAHWLHRGTAANTTTSGTGFANDTSGAVQGTSAGFDNTALGGQYVGLSINGGASAAWTLTQCFGRVWY